MWIPACPKQGIEVLGGFKNPKTLKTLKGLLGCCLTRHILEYQYASPHLLFTGSYQSLPRRSRVSFRTLLFYKTQVPGGVECSSKPLTPGIKKISRSGSAFDVVHDDKVGGVGFVEGTFYFSKKSESAMRGGRLEASGKLQQHRRQRWVGVHASHRQFSRCQRSIQVCCVS